MTTLAARLVERFAWIEGHADVWGLFSEGLLLREIAAALASPFAAAGVTKVAGVESRGFILGSAVAIQLEVGFAAIRKEQGMLPGEKVTRRAAADYQGIKNVLRLQRSALQAGDSVLLVDDWVEVGSQALAAKGLLADAGAVFAGCSVIVDDTSAAVREQLHPFHALLPVVALGPDS